MNEENWASRLIVDSAIEAHRALGGPGLIASVYEEALAYELEHRSAVVRRQVPIPIVYKGVDLGSPLRVDLIVNECVLVECKAISTFNKIFQVQVLTYLRLTRLKLGMVINFGESRVIDGIHRIANGLTPATQEPCDDPPLD